MAFYSVVSAVPSRYYLTYYRIINEKAYYVTLKQLTFAMLMEDMNIEKKIQQNSKTVSTFFVMHLIVDRISFNEDMT